MSTAVVAVMDKDEASTTGTLAVRQEAFASVTQLKSSLEEWGQKRAVIAQFLKSQLKRGIDFGPVHISKNCEAYKQRRVCTNDYHWSKDSLFKPGSEKVMGLLQLRSTFERDAETWEMLGKPDGVLCFRCLLLTPTGEIVGEGRGARDVQKQDYGDINKAVKQCQKSAQVDAILRVVALSDVFTQDLEQEADAEDGPSDERAELGEETAARSKDKIKQLLAQLGSHPQTAAQARWVIANMTGYEFVEANYPKIIQALETTVAGRRKGAL